MPAMKVVLDTNVWLDWLLFDDPGVAALRAAVDAGTAEVLIDAPCEAELERVLGYRFYGETLPPEKQAACLAECRRIARRVEADMSAAGRNAGRLPACRDPDDQKFLELAAAARADALVTKDDALLALADRGLPFLIAKPAMLRA
jgi:putative PIN family toxin of toxin-antitoxin system